MGNDPKWNVLPDWRDQREFLSQAVSHLSVAKDAWRSYHAHARGNFTEEEAGLLFDNVCAILRKIATRLREA
jgi:hypothetical protein